MLFELAFDQETVKTLLTVEENAKLGFSLGHLRPVTLAMVLFVLSKIFVRYENPTIFARLMAMNLH